jgi:peptidoglycan hydrolase CwlO-like protein
MAKRSAAPSREILEAALQGLEAQKDKLEQQIEQVRVMMGRRTGKPPKADGSEANESRRAGARKTRSLSAEARKRIAAAQKKRWAAFRKSQG